MFNNAGKDQVWKVQALKMPAVRLLSATLVMLVPTGFFAQHAFAQESTQGAALSQSAAAPTQNTATATGDRRLTELFYQMQILQQEVQELRGLVEEQTYHLNRLARDQKEQYIDLDRRVAGLTTGGVVVGSAASGASGSANPSAGFSTGSTGTSGAAVASSGGGTTSTGSVPAAGASGTTLASLPAGSQTTTERDAYQRAFDLMKGRNFEDSIASFNALITNYPNGQYTPNAFYWLGELHLAQQSTEEARQAFMQVVNLYPDHPKVPDTLYKLGVAYHRLGDVDRAMDYFGQVQSRYPQSSAAGLAASYAREIR